MYEEVEVELVFTTPDERDNVLSARPNLCDFGICLPVNGRNGTISLDEIDKCRLFIRHARMNPLSEFEMQWFPWKTQYGKEWGKNGRSSYMWANLISTWEPPHPDNVFPDRVCNGAMIVASVLEGLKLTPVYQGDDPRIVNPSVWISKPVPADRPTKFSAGPLSLIGQFAAMLKDAK